MRQSIKILTLVTSVVLGTSAGAVRADPQTEQEAQQQAIIAAENWLTLVDTEVYAQSWEEAAAFFKNVLPQQDWVSVVAGVRDPLGKVISRRLQSAQFTATLPGAPDGAYVVIQYETDFENKKDAVETITPMQEPDGTWRVSGYYIK